MQRDRFIDFARAMLILLVLVGHHIQFVLYNGSDRFWADPVFKLIYIFHMPLFMGVSGYLAGCSLGRHSLVAHIRKKSLQLILPMAFWCLLGALPALLDGASTGRFGRLWIGSFLGNYWFLWAVLFSYALTRAALYVPLKPEISLGAISLLLILLPVQSTIYGMTAYLFPFFATGYLTHVRGYRIQPTMPRVMLLLALAVPIYLLWSRQTYIYNNRLRFGSLAEALDIGLMFLGGAVFCLLAIWLLRWAATAMEGLPGTGQLFRLGKVTLQIYLVQDVYFEILAVSRIAIEPSLFWLVVLPASLLVAGVIAILVYQTRSTWFSGLVWGISPRASLEEGRHAVPTVS